MLLQPTEFDERKKKNKKSKKKKHQNNLNVYQVTILTTTFMGMSTTQARIKKKFTWPSYIVL